MNASAPISTGAPRKLLGAQHATEPVGRIENGDIGAFAERTADPVGGHQT